MPGDELWPGRLELAEERVRAALARRGFRSPTVEARLVSSRAVAPGDATPGEDGSAVAERLELVVAVSAGPPTRVEQLTIDGEKLPEGLASGLDTRPGAPLDLEALEGDLQLVRARLRRAGHLRARVAPPVIDVAGEVARVRVEVRPGPRVRFRFRGAGPAFSAAELQRELGLEEEGLIDAPALQVAAGRLRAYLVAQGYAEARVAVDEHRAGDELTVLFDVQLRRRYRVRRVAFTGADGREPGWLRERLDEALVELAPASRRGAEAEAERLARAGGSPAPIRTRAEADPRLVWNPTLWEQAVERLVERERAEGWLDAAHESTRVALDARDGTADVQIAFRRGVLTRVERVDLEGASALPAAELRALVRLSPGDPLGAAEVEATRAALLELYERRGFAYARVTASEEVSADRARAVVRLRVEEGPEVHIGEVLVSGARRTREEIVREVVAIGPGDLHRPQALAEGQSALLRLGVFRSVALRLVEPDLEAPVKDLQVDLSELPYMTMTQTVGFSLANGPRATLELARPNLLGRALELTARAKVNYPLAALRADEASLSRKRPIERVEGRVELGLRDPLLSLFGLGKGARFTALAEQLHRPSYDLSRAAGGVALEVPMAGPVLLTLQYELEVDRITRSAVAQTLTLVDVERLRFPEGYTTLQSFRPVLAVDRRDSSLHPRRGWVASATLEVIHSLGDGLVFGRPVAALTGYLPLPSGSVLALSLRGGRVVAFGDYDTSIVPPRRFFLGGASTLRGYGEDELVPEDVRAPYLREIATCRSSLSGLACSQVARQLEAGQTLVSEGGQAFVLAKAELRFPLYASLEGGLFTDVGNLWLDPGAVRLEDVRVSFGAGLRFLTPIGPAVLDLGLNPTADGRLGERVLAPHFSIGLF